MAEEERRHFHYRDDRQIREKIIRAERLDEGHTVALFRVCDEDGTFPQIRLVTSTGLIIVKAERTGRVITKMIARPEQIRKLYRGIGLEPPAELLEIAERNKQLGLNRI